MKEIVRERAGVALVFGIYYLAFVAYGVASGAASTIFYAVFVGGLALLVAALYPRIRFSPLVLWSLALWGLAHMAGGLIEFGGEVLYEIELGADQMRFDKPVHFFGFGAATLAAYEVLRATIASQSPPRSVAIGAFFVGLGLGAINETVEFLITLLPGENNVGGFTNTGWDLVANAVGAALATWLAPRRLLGERLSPVRRGGA